jgi:hypothetical protein
MLLAFGVGDGQEETHRRNILPAARELAERCLVHGGRGGSLE